MLRKSLFIATSSALAQGIVAVLYIAVARISGPSELGGIVAAVAAANFLAGVLDFGTNNLWVREVVSQRMSFERLFIHIISKNVIVLVPSAFLGIIALLAFPQTYLYAVCLLAVTVAYFQSMLSPLKATASGTRLSLALTMERALAALAFIILLISGIDAPISLILALAIGSIASGTLAYFLAPRSARRLHMSKKLVWPWRASGSYGIGGVTLAAQSLDSTILHAVAGPVATGIYGAVNRWTQPLGVFASAFSTAGLPYVARSQSLRKSYKSLSRAWWMLCAAGIICLLVAFLSPFIVQLLLGHQYRESAPVLTVLALGTIPALLNQPLYVFMQAMNLDRFVAKAVICTVTMQLIMCAVLGSLYEELGAAISFAAAQSLLLLLFAFILAKYSKV